jgi:phospholipase C
MTSRRDFLRMAAATAGGAASTLLPASISRALAIPAAGGTGTIADVEHVVVFMQENRSFDHYFGHLPGVRGYNDRFPVTLPSGKPVWFQPRKGNPGAVVAPFHLDTKATGAQCVGDLDHSWVKTQNAINGGRYDAWPENKTDMTMGYHLRSDIPFHYALADAFTVCDQYFCSIPAQTHPNRVYLMTGMVDPTGAGGGPLLDNNDTVVVPKLPPFTWTTFPERLQAAGVSWQVYQQGLDFSDDYDGNYGTNVLAMFQQYIDAPAGSPLQTRGMSVRTLDRLAEDVERDKLPQVSWLLPPAVFSEHPRYMPAYGATYIARILDALTANPKVWSKTVLLLMYDENDGFFDHVVPPQPPMSPRDGLSTISVAGERHDVVNPLHKPVYTVDNLPYGLGPRVPMIVISPWSKGGYVCSQVFDHTSVIQFIEKRFGVHEPNVTEWRRAVCGNLMTAFNFAAPDAALAPLPDTTGYRARADAQCTLLPKPVVPDAGALPAIGAQERGTRRARALPYRLRVDAKIDGGPAVELTFRNLGAQAAHFTVHSRAASDAPRRYTVGAGHTVADSWAIGAVAFELSVRGPNGFFRSFAGTPAHGSSAVELHVDEDAGRGDVLLALHNGGAAGVDVVVRDGAYGRPERRLHVAAGAARNERWSLAASAHWYDVIAICGGVTYRAAGHVETGRASTTDPAMARGAV